jgi:hypothetical protein
MTGNKLFESEGTLLCVWLLAAPIAGRERERNRERERERETV